MNKIITEITPLSEKDCFYLVERLKDRFNYPLHRHSEYELNFVSGCSGARRVVGDSVEVLGEYDLALIGNSIEHGWEQHQCDNVPIREITIQFDRNLFGDMLEKNSFSPLKRLLEESSTGIAFSMDSIMRVFGKIEKLVKMETGFYRMLLLMEILFELAVHEDSYRRLSTSAFAKVTPTVDSRRVAKVQAYVDANYKNELRLADLASLVGMTPTSFSRFFKQRCGKSLMEYVIDIRLGHASRLLIDTTMSVSEICYECGFKNVSNFNRIFKASRNRTPKEFREIYKHHRSLI